MTLAQHGDDENCAIILSAGLASRCNAILQGGFKFMLPLLDMPIGFKQIKQLHDQGITTIVLVASKLDIQKHQEFLNSFCASLGIKLICAQQNTPKGPGHAFYKGLLALENSPPNAVILLLADTYIPDALPEPYSDAIVISTKVAYSANWCWAKFRHSEGNVLNFLDKKTPPDEEMSYGAVCGVYSFRCYEDAKEAAIRAVEKNRLGEVQISTILETYMEQHPIKVIETQAWLDFGSLRNYQDSYQKSLYSNKNINEITLKEDAIVKTYPSDPAKIESELACLKLISETPLGVKAWKLNQHSYALEHIDSHNIGYIYNFLPLVKTDHVTILVKPPNLGPVLELVG